MNWQPLNFNENKLAWDFIFQELHFSPYSEKFKKISLKDIYKCYDISSHYNSNFSEEFYRNFHHSALRCFRLISNNDFMYALNWQHDCYKFYPARPFETDKFGEWLIPIFPNGDYLFFLTSDFKNGFFGNGIDLQIILFGENMIQEFDFKK